MFSFDIVGLWREFWSKAASSRCTTELPRMARRTTCFPWKRWQPERSRCVTKSESRRRVPRWNRKERREEGRDVPDTVVKRRGERHKKRQGDFRRARQCVRASHRNRPVIRALSIPCTNCSTHSALPYYADMLLCQRRRTCLPTEPTRPLRRRQRCFLASVWKCRPTERDRTRMAFLCQWIDP